MSESWNFDVGNLGVVICKVGFRSCLKKFVFLKNACNLALKRTARAPIGRSGQRSSATAPLLEKMQRLGKMRRRGRYGRDLGNSSLARGTGEDYRRSRSNQAAEPTGRLSEYPTPGRQ